MKPLTRRNVIEIWKNQDPKYLDRLVCPHCRDLLHKTPKGLECMNQHCLNTSVYEMTSTGVKVT